MKTIFKRSLSVLLAVILLCGGVPFSGLLIPASAYSVGDTFQFGIYPQVPINDPYLSARLAELNFDSEGFIYYQGSRYSKEGSTYMRFEPITWRVLSVDSSGIFVISDKVLDAKPYNTAYTGITWADCTLRTWLNSTFYNRAFSSSEKLKINTTHLVNGDNPTYGTEGGIETNDKIFVLSLSDSLNTAYGFPNSYDSSPSRIAYATEYAKLQGCPTDSYRAFWWLRTPGGSSYYACHVSYYGIVDNDTTSIMSTVPLASVPL